jgi:hypothetical protein
MGGVVSTPSILLLSSRPALATSSRCTISGMHSGNLSKPSTVTCRGLTPGYWKNHTSLWPGGCVAQPPNPVTGKPNDYTVPTLAQLDDAVAKGKITLAQKNDYLAKLSLATKFNMIFGGLLSTDCYLTQALSAEDPGNPYSVAPVLAHCVAAYFNAWRFGRDAYGYLPSEIVAMVQARLLSDPIGLKDDLQMLNERG